eukprot:TRINITY_DN14615_c0_g1_i2.p1 TRINITY_DN14615_c0_g1~~TRINITY_DN14615_c0_g1_i2.p1  ORF type:complete len:294 (-),score=24.54 TRINITY_DN14615_c0_g1_i2:206-1087(-)
MAMLPRAALCCPKRPLRTAGQEDASLQALTTGLTLAGKPLAALKIVHVDWHEDQMFSVSDDPDRVAMPWRAPKFVTTKDPIAQRSKTVVEDLEIRSTQRGSFARVVSRVLDEEDCAELIAAVNNKGFTPALINIGGGRQQLMPEVRDGHRVIVDSPELANWIFKVVEPYLPSVMPDGSTLTDLNERCRVLCYTPGQIFEPHYDGCYRRPTSHRNAGDRSAVTVQVYLHDVPSSAGGATTFLFDDHSELPCQPAAGSVLLFTQDLFHEGSVLQDGLKYTLRTEAMYRPQARRGT